MKNLAIFFIGFLLLMLLNSCKEHKQKLQVVSPKVKVSLSKIEHTYIPDNLELSGKTIYINKSNIISPISGYITEVGVQQGDVVKKGQMLFEIKTSEAYLMQNFDSLSQIKYGMVKIYATVSGRIMNMNVMNKGVFVDKGSVMCIIMSSNDLKLQVNVPFEYNKWTKIGNRCTIILPDSSEIIGKFSKYLPQINETSQTLKILANINTSKFLPENMIVKVLVDKSTKKEMITLPKSCLQTNALMTKFWVMKLINDSTAEQITVKVGNVNHDKFEIISPEFKPTDNFISEGAYGLEGTVIIDKN